MTTTANGTEGAPGEPMPEMAAAAAILRAFYPEETPMRLLLEKHSRQVAEMAAEILAGAPVPLRETIAPGDVVMAAMLHDIGIGRCHAPGIHCFGDCDYIAHGVLGGEMLRKYAAEHGADLEFCARVCERHTGSGLTRREILDRRMPIAPPRDLLPETPLEKLICLADKFYSKSGAMERKPLEKVRRSMAKFGDAPLARFDELMRFFRFSDGSGE